MNLTEPIGETDELNGLKLSQFGYNSSTFCDHTEEG